MAFGKKDGSQAGRKKDGLRRNRNTKPCPDGGEGYGKGGGRGGGRKRRK